MRMMPRAAPYRISLCTDIAHEKKITGLPQIWILTLSLLNLTSEVSAYKPTPENMQHIRRTSKHGISMIMSSQ